MCYEDRITDLVNALRPLVKFADVLQAEQYTTYWKPVNVVDKQTGKARPSDEINQEEAWKAEIGEEIERLARMLLESADFNETLKCALDAITSSEEDKVRLSALREAIRGCAQARLLSRNARIDAELALVAAAS